MSEKIIKLGQLFKGKRKELNLSLKEVESSTSIRANYLQAIEEGTIKKYLSSVYSLGFMKQYANFLGFDQDKLTKDHPEIFDPKLQTHDFSYGIGTLEVRGSAGGGVKWLPNLLWATLSVGILILAYFLSKFWGIF